MLVQCCRIVMNYGLEHWVCILTNCTTTLINQHGLKLTIQGSYLLLHFLQPNKLDSILGSLIEQDRVGWWALQHICSIIILLYVQMEKSHTRKHKYLDSYFISTPHTTIHFSKCSPVQCLAKLDLIVWSIESRAPLTNIRFFIFENLL